MAGTTRLELATSAVTGQRSNQLNYVPSLFSSGSRETLDTFLLLSVDSPVSAISARNHRIPEANGKETERNHNARILGCDPANAEHLSIRCEQIVSDRLKISTDL